MPVILQIATRRTSLSHSSLCQCLSSAAPEFNMKAAAPGYSVSSVSLRPHSGGVARTTSPIPRSTDGTDFLPPRRPRSSQVQQFITATTRWLYLGPVSRSEPRGSQSWSGQVRRPRMSVTLWRVCPGIGGRRGRWPVRPARLWPQVAFPGSGGAGMPV